MKTLVSIFAFLLILTAFTSCEEESELSPLCKGKTVLKITESPMDAKVYFTDGSSYEVWSTETVFTEYNEKEN